MQGGVHSAVVAAIAGIGVLTDRLGRKIILMASTVASSVFVTLHAVAPTALVLGVFRTLGYTAGGLQVPVAGTIIVEESPARFRGVLTGILQTGYPLGWFLASLLAAPVLAEEPPEELTEPDEPELEEPDAGPSEPLLPEEFRIDLALLNLRDFGFNLNDRGVDPPLTVGADEPPRSDHDDRIAARAAGPGDRGVAG